MRNKDRRQHRQKDFSRKGINDSPIHHFLTWKLQPTRLLKEPAISPVTGTFLQPWSRALVVYLNMRNGITAKKGKLVKSYTLTTVEESITKVHEERDLFICSADKVFSRFSVHGKLLQRVIWWVKGLGGGDGGRVRVIAKQGHPPKVIWN